MQDVGMAFVALGRKAHATGAAFLARLRVWRAQRASDNTCRKTSHRPFRSAAGCAAPCWGNCRLLLILAGKLPEVTRPSSQPAVASAPTAVRDDDKHLIIEVRDEGPGIPEALLARAMKPFYRLESSRNAGTGGHGVVATLVLPRGLPYRKPMA